jgi:hypothetical protein
MKRVSGTGENCENQIPWDCVYCTFLYGCTYAWSVDRKLIEFFVRQFCVNFEPRFFFFFLNPCVVQVGVDL